MKTHLCRLLLLGGLLAGGLITSVARADHRDATNQLADPRTNINDVYAFVNPATSNVVLAMTLNGYTLPGVKPVFSTGCLYQFKIDNTGDFIEDLVVQVVFDKPAGPAFTPTQGFTVIGPIKPPRVGGTNSLARTKVAPASGTTTTGANTFVIAANGMKIFCGLRDDPFFFDEVYIRNILRGTLAAPSPPQTRSITPGIDYYAGLNCSVIAIEVPPALLTGILTHPVSNQKQINVWATANVSTSVARSLRSPARGEPLELRESASKSYIQYDRTALPGVSTFFIAEEDKNSFSAGLPKDDVKFFATPARPLIQKLQLSPASPGAVAAADQTIARHFPNVLRLDVTNTAGFSADNGRRPNDDVIDRNLNLITVGALTNDGVPANDSPFLTDFPFFAAPHLATEIVPRHD